VPALERLCAELRRLEMMCELEERLACAGFSPVAGVDEAGRGCLAGPVVAAAVIPADGPPIAGVDDSKKLAAETRGRLAARIRATARAWAVAEIPADEIDASNILAATKRAMCDALARLDPRPAVAIVDAVVLADTGLPALALVKGDALAYATACAALVAKDHRDRRLAELGTSWPQYGFERHKGYAAPEHLAALERFGPCPEHRLSFARVIPRREAA